jgi:hypothetical protein
MNLDELERKLIAVGRTHRPSDRVPYAFEKRIMARLGDRPIRDYWELWGRALWCAAAPCAAIMLALGAWSFFATQGGASTNDLSQDLEQTLLAAVDQDQTTDATW